MPYLLITGNTNIQRLTSLYVRQMGLTLNIANNGKEGLKKVLAKEFDLILVDMQLPTMSGIDTTKSLRRSGYRGLIIALKENSVDDSKPSYRAVGCNDVIALPIERNEFIHLMEKSIAKLNKDNLSQQPIICTMEFDDEVISQLVEKYVSMLPTMIADIRQVYEKRNIEKFKVLVHDLKSTGGNYGYMIVTKLAAGMEACVRDNKITEIKVILDELDKVVQQIQLGWTYGQGNDGDVAINS